MIILQSNMDALLVAIPMVGIMFAGVFRLDELLGKPRKKSEWRRPIAGSDANGAPICVDPDGKRHDRGAKPL